MPFFLPLLHFVQAPLSHSSCCLHFIFRFTVQTIRPSFFLFIFEMCNFLVCCLRAQCHIEAQSFIPVISSGCQDLDSLSEGLWSIMWPISCFRSASLPVQGSTLAYPSTSIQSAVHLIATQKKISKLNPAIAPPCLVVCQYMDCYNRYDCKLQALLHSF